MYLDTNDFERKWVERGKLRLNCTADKYLRRAWQGIKMYIKSKTS